MFEKLKALRQLFLMCRFNMVGKTDIIHENMIGKTVIRFTTHGCMATIHEFDYIGVIVEKRNAKYCGDGKMFYRVKVLKNKNGYELRDSKEDIFREVPSWYLQNLGGDFYVVYDL